MKLSQQRYSCHGCGNCCRDFTVQLRDEDVAKLREQDWESKLGEPVMVEFGGTRFLRQREDGSCVFLMENGLCRIHAEYGFEAKPIACQLFPFHLTPTWRGVQMGLNFACQSVLENKGAALPSHGDDLGRMAGELDELAAKRNPPLLADDLPASAGEVQSLINHLDGWVKKQSIPLATRIDGLAWIVTSLNQAQLANVRDDRFAELMTVLTGALPDELDHHPVTAPGRGQIKMVRRAVFARTEDPKLNRITEQGRIRTVVDQLLRLRRFARGRGVTPPVGVDWPTDVPLEYVERIVPTSDPSEAAAIDDLMTRYLRASIIGQRYWGAAYYGWPITRGLLALLLNLACVGWLARLHAAGRDRGEIDLPAVQAALGRVDRTSGRARWLGSSGERWRLRYLTVDDGMRRILDRYRLIASNAETAAAHDDAIDF